MPAASVGHYASLSFVVIGRGQMTEDREQQADLNRHGEAEVDGNSKLQIKIEYND